MCFLLVKYVSKNIREDAPDAPAALWWYNDAEIILRSRRNLSQEGRVHGFMLLMQYSDFIYLQLQTETIHLDWLGKTAWLLFSFGISFGYRT